MRINPHGSRASRIAAEVLGTSALFVTIAAQITGALLSMLEYRVERGAYESADDVHHLAGEFVAEHLAALYSLGVPTQVIEAQAANLAGRVGALVVALAEREARR